MLELIHCNNIYDIKLFMSKTSYKMYFLKISEKSASTV